jgi:uncharacterized protein
MNKVKTIKVRELKNFWQRLTGEIGRKIIIPIYFETRFGVHTFGVRHPIDVLILDENSLVVKKKTLKPNRIFVWPIKYNRVVELPAGSLISVRERLELRWIT